MNATTLCAAGRPQRGMAPFPWCVHNTTTAADGFVEVRFKAASGEKDQAGGAVWRWKEGNNYYVARTKNPMLNRA